MKDLTLKNEANALSSILMHLSEKTALVYRNLYVMCGHNNPIIRNLHKRGLLRLVKANGIECVKPAVEDYELYRFISENSGVVYLNYFKNNSNVLYSNHYWSK